MKSTFSVLLRALPSIAIALSLTLLPTACGETTVTSVGLGEWCIRVEMALRDRAIDCECPGEPPDDEELAARCMGLPAMTLDGAIEDDEVGWNGVLAASLIERMRTCEGRPVADDPVIGDVALGEPCRVFEDVAMQPDDCELGSSCVRSADAEMGRCVALVGDGVACGEESACEPGLVCGEDGTCAAPTTSPCGSF